VKSAESYRKSNDTKAVQRWMV